MTSKALLDEVKAEEELFARGWIKEPCSACNGTGRNLEAEKKDPENAHWYYCFSCDARGWNWKGPVTK